MARDRIYNGPLPSHEFVSNPFGDYYQFESRDYIFGKSSNAILDPEIASHISGLNSIKATIGIGNSDKPSQVSASDYANRFGKRMAYDASSFYITAKNYLVNAENASYDMAPLMRYYGYMFLHSSLSNMFYRTLSKKETHGIAIRWPKGVPNDNASLKENKINLFLNELSVEVQPYGAFARSRDFYSINGYYSVFSLIKKDSTGNIIENPNALLTNKSRVFKLKEILNYRYSTYSALYDLGSSEILFDYLGLFALSSLARYRPTMWRQISSGIGELFPDLLAINRHLIDYYCLVHQIMQKRGMINEQYN